MKRLMMMIAGIVLLVLTGCSSTRPVTMYEASVPMREQSIILRSNRFAVYIITVDDKSVPISSIAETYIPAGFHKLEITVSGVATVNNRRVTIRAPGIILTHNFEAGHIYSIETSLGREISETSIEISAGIVDVTDSSEWDPVPVGLLSRHSGPLTTWDRPAGFYLQSAFSGAVYLGYHNITMDNDSQEPDSRDAFGIGVNFQLGFDTGYAKFGAQTLVDFSIGLGNGLTGYGLDGSIGLMEFFYYGAFPKTRLTDNGR